MSLLYLHPSGHLNDLVVPAGALSAVNAVTGPKLGRFAFEVTDDELGAARVIAIDLHWALALPGFEALARRVRRVSPGAAIVAGGISAGLWASRLLDDGLADYVISGDAEPSFAGLVSALEGGTPVPDLANVWRRGGSPPRYGASTAEAFDATDSLTADWFPSYQRAQGIAARALSHELTIVAARGCSLRCPGCYGSYLGKSGGPMVARSAQSLVAGVRRAAEQGARDLVLLWAKPAGSAYDAQLGALAEQGPFPVGDHVGLFTCRAPSSAQVALLERAFPCKVGISALDPADREPAAPPERLAADLGSWQQLARVVRQREQLELVLWVSDPARLGERREQLGADGQRIRVAWSATWEMARPRVDAADDGYATLGPVMASVWTIGAARLLAPELGRLLAPFRWLDELESEPELPAQLDPRLAPFVRRILDGWTQHRLPTLPGLGFVAVPLASWSRSQERGGPRWTGELAGGRGEPSGPDTPIALAAERDHRGMALRTRLPEQRAAALGFLPTLDGARPDAGELERARVDALVALRLPDGAVPAGAELEVRFVLDAAEVTLRDGSGRSVASGRGDLGFYSGRLQTG